MARQLGAASLIGDDTQSAAILRVKLVEARLRIANLEADKRRLEAFVARHMPNAESDTARRAAAKTANTASDYQRAFECTASALEALIRHAEVYGVDPSSSSLVDLAARPGSPPVVGSYLIKDFVAWQKAKKAGC
ncbi:hypothetical protein ACFQY5_33125 [Paeniroseomonas aquatica]|uniref:hypothetical protein n=1 Tax=Paeniroseomonas aquatica TaxID=373043 RepID=UPI00360C0C61